MMETHANATFMRDSAQMLKELYEIFTEKARTMRMPKVKLTYPECVVEGEDLNPHAVGWFLLYQIPLNIADKNIIDAMLSIYGLAEEIRPTGRGDYYVKFENDQQVDDVIQASRTKRLNVRGNKVECYRLRQAPV